MKVTEQVDAMRALGTDPVRKLVTPRVYATVIMLFFLTIVSDAVGIAGGALVSIACSASTSQSYYPHSYQIAGARRRRPGPHQAPLFRLHHLLRRLLSSA